MFVVWRGHEFVAREFFTIQVHFHHVASIIRGNFASDLKIEMRVADRDSVPSEISDESGRIRIRSGRIRVRGEPKLGDWARENRKCQILAKGIFDWGCRGVCDPPHELGLTDPAPRDFLTRAGSVADIMRV